VKRTHRGLILTGISLACVATIVVFVTTSGGTRLGPLRFGGVHDLVTGPMIIGHAFTYGHIVIYNSSRHKAVLDSVELVDPTPGFAVVATSADRPSRDAPEGLVARSPHYPPGLGLTLHPLDGFVVPAARGSDADAVNATAVNLVLGLRIPAERRYRFDSVIVRYHVGSEHFALPVPQGFLACGVRALRHAPDCDGPLENP
jgi:hypothetical protein